MIADVGKRSITRPYRFLDEPNRWRYAFSYGMDAILLSDIEISRSDSPGEKLAQALEIFETGIRLKRAALKKACPDASEAEIERYIEQWLTADG